MRRFFSAISRALRRALAMSFKFLGSIIGAFTGGDYDDEIHEDVIEVEAESTALDDIADLKRWLTDVMCGRHAVPPSGHFSGWARALDDDSVRRLARAAITGHLDGHLSRRAEIVGVPPVLSYSDTREWLQARDAARRRKEARASANVNVDTMPDPTPTAPGYSLSLH